MRSGKVRENCVDKVRESQGIQIELTGGNPVTSKYTVHVTIYVQAGIQRGKVKVPEFQKKIENIIAKLGIPIQV